MGHLSLNDTGVILDNAADVIEGGNAWRGSGTAYKGIPGLYSNDPDLRLNQGLSFGCTGTGATGRIPYAAGEFAADKFTRVDAPAFWAICTHSVNATSADNENKARKISSWVPASTWFLTDEWPAAPKLGDGFTISQGFKRTKNFGDIDESPDGFDRFFSLSLMPESRLPYAGDGKETYRGLLRLRLRICKFGRTHDAEASAAANILILRSGLTRGSGENHREDTYTRAILAPVSAPSLVVSDKNKAIIEDTYPVIYSIDRTFG